MATNESGRPNVLQVRTLIKSHRFQSSATIKTKIPYRRHTFWKAYGFQRATFPKSKMINVLQVRIFLKSHRFQTGAVIKCESPIVDSPNC
jgi:hypothetical protein